MDSRLYIVSLHLEFFVQGHSKHFYSGPARAWHGEVTPFMTSYCTCAHTETLWHCLARAVKQQFMSPRPRVSSRRYDMNEELENYAYAHAYCVPTTRP